MKQIHVPSLVLSIVGLVFALLLPIVAYVCCIVGLVLAYKYREANQTIAAMVMCIVGLAIALINSILGAMIMTSMYI